MYVVPVAWLTHAVAVRGADAPDIRAGLAAANLSPGFLDGDADQIAASSFVQFIEEAARVAGEEFYGLDLGLGYDVRASGLAAYVSLACSTARESLRNACRYGAISDTSADYALAETPDEAFFRIETRSPPIRLSRQATEFKVALIFRACLTFVGPALRPREARFSVARVNARDAARRFGCPVTYGAEASGLAFVHEQLELAPHTSDPYLLDLLERVAASCLAKRSPARDATRTRVERLLLDALSRGAPTARQVAEALGISERTLARRLVSEGTSFGQVLDEIRRDMALGYLEDPTILLSQIAYLLGYADQSAFSNAFRRWTGQSPSRFRAEAAVGD
ncbi:MAG: AraC family transcriptional regulator ligand-binding domain-containing protein [Amaricoccus sp.]|uniref:AraC family transcriptional regulator n=1 Tax=Amaricoccus sp. TaxID=1872485 RepID=UPI0039E56832